MKKIFIIVITSILYFNKSYLIDCAKEGNKDIKHFETSIFDGNYVCGSVTKEYLTNLELERKDANKSF